MMRKGTEKEELTEKCRAIRTTDSSPSLGNEAGIKSLLPENTSNLWKENKLVEGYKGDYRNLSQPAVCPHVGRPHLYPSPLQSQDRGFSEDIKQPQGKCLQH